MQNVPLPSDLTAPAPAPAPAKRPLAGRLDEVASRAAAGLSNKQIALELGLSEATVKVHLKQVYLRLRIATRTELVRVYPVSLDERPLPPPTPRTLAELRAPEPRPPKVTRADQLTAPQAAVIAAVSRGLTNQQIADELDTSVMNVKRIVKDLMDKTGRRNRTELARWWVVVCNR